MKDVRSHLQAASAADLSNGPTPSISDAETEEQREGQRSARDGKEKDRRATAMPYAKPRAGSPLDRAAQDRRLLVRYHENRDAAARNALVSRFLPLARQLARRYQHTGEPLDDLVQVASLGLLKAIDRFDPTRGTAFSSFAVPTILGELKRHIRDRGWSVRVPRELQELAISLERLSDELWNQSGRSPTIDELAKHLGVSGEQVLEAREANAAYRAISLDQPRDDDDDESFAQNIGAEDPGFRLTEDAATIEKLMTVLSDRERQVLQLRFTDDLKQSEIGAEIGVSQMQVCRIIRQAVSRLQEEAEQLPQSPSRFGVGTRALIASPARTRGVRAQLQP